MSARGGAGDGGACELREDGARRRGLGGGPHDVRFEKPGMSPAGGVHDPRGGGDGGGGDNRAGGGGGGAGSCDVGFAMMERA